MNHIKLDNSRRWGLGVCSGLSRHFKINKYILRFLFFLSSLLVGGFGILIYIVLYISMFSKEPEKPKLMGVLSYIGYKKNIDVFYLRFLFCLFGLITGIIPFLFLYVIAGTILRFKQLKKLV